MGKHLDELGKIEDFQAPWETATGETEIVPDKLKRYIFGLLKDKASAQDARDESTEKVKEVTAERDEVKSKLESGGDADLKKELDAEREKTAKETERADKAERAILIRDIADDKGLTKDQAERLRGTTKEELEADADDLLKTFGIEGKVEDGDEGQETLRRTPRRGVNPGDPQQLAKGPEGQQEDPEAIVAGFRRNRF